MLRVLDFHNERLELVIVLVDYDNVPELERNRGPVHVITKIVDTLGTALAGETELRFRLYGGWFQGATLSRRAQQLLPVLRAQFPRATAAPIGIGPVSLLSRAELALSMELAPGRHLTHTYRDRALPNNVRCAYVLAAPRRDASLMATRRSLL